jgi:chloride channel protein, CIC family
MKIDLKRLLGLQFYRRLIFAEQKRLIYFLSMVVGLVSALAAVILKNTIHFMHKLLTSGFVKEDSESYLFLAYPLMGIILTWLFVKYVVRDEISHGVSRILKSISKGNSVIKKHNNWSSIVASTITIGFGGSVGAEAPIVLTGASLGSNIGRWFGLNYKQITLLLGCGAAGAVSGIFKAPLAGIIFTLEILMLDLTISSIVPLLIASVTASTVAYFFMGNEVLFSFAVKETFMLSNLPWYALLGVFTGIVSAYFSRVTLYAERQYEKITTPLSRVFIGGMLLGVLIFLFPPLYGEGYETIMSLLNGDTEAIFESSLFSDLSGSFVVLLLFLAALVLMKVIATSSTNGAGGVGGIFAPSLFVGGVSGFFIASFLNGVFGLGVPESSFVLTGMAGTMAAIMHAPLTAIFLIAEITEGYGLLIPLIVTSTISFITIRGFEKHSIYHKQLAKAGELITHDKDQAVLTLMDWTKEIEKDLATVKSSDTLGQLVKVISTSRRNMFPVVDDYNVLEGVVLLDDVRKIMFDTDKYDEITVSELMTIPPSYIDLSEKMNVVMDIFNKAGVWNLPVLDNGIYVGFISKSRIFAAYRELLVQVTEE